MKKFLQILVNHKWAIVLAVLVGIIIVFPQAYFRYDNKDIYQGIEINLGGADEAFYLNRIQEIRDGHFSLGNSCWIEGKDLPYLQPSLSEKINALTGQFFGLNLANTVLLERFLFPIIIFLFIYVLVYFLTKRKITASMAAVVVLLSTELTSPRILWNLLIHQMPDRSLPFSHIISPQTHLLFFFGFLLFFWIFLENKKWIYGIISSIILGLSFYTYPYTWTFLYTFLGILIIIFIYRKMWPEIKNIILISLGGVIIASLYFWNIFKAMQYPLYSEISLRFGIVKTHLPQVGLTVLILLILFLFFFPRLEEKKYSFFLALVLAPFIVLNQQIITGMAMMPDHYHWYCHKPLALIIIIIIIFSQIEKRIKKHFFKKIFIISLVGLILFVNFYNGILVQNKVYNIHKEPAIENQQYGPVFEWLNNHSQKDEVIMTNNYVSRLVVIYTSLNSVTNLGSAHYYLAADENQLWQRMFLEHRLNGLEGEEAFKIFSKDRIYISGEVYGEYYRKSYKGHENIPDEKIYSIAEEYKKSLDIPLKDILRKYQVKYLIWDTNADPNWSIDKYSFFEQVYQVKDIKIYQIIY
ncbi:MAG: hypothetical protein ABIG88_02525 [Patescibacteria group bacterium]